VEGKAIFRLIRAKVQHETKIQIEKRMCSAVRRFRIAKRAGGRKSDIPPDKSKSAARDEDPNSESKRAARDEDPNSESKSAARDEDPNRKANVQHETKIPYSKAGGGTKSDIPPGESARVARYEKSIYRMMGEEAAGDLVRTDLWRDHDGAEGARLKS
jgi:hypothetical protein